MDAWEALMLMIKEQGVEMVFGLGDNYLNMLAEEAGLLAVNVRHESSAPFMAMAYSRLTGKIGLVSASPGPGTANLVPGVLEAYSASLPLVLPCHSAAVSTSGRGEFQECDQVSLMEPITKWSTQLPKAELLPWYVRRAFTKSLNGSPGPVYLDLPHDIMGPGPLRKDNTNQSEKEKFNISFPGEFRPATKKRIPASKDSIIKTLTALKKAHNPVIVFGNGAILSRAFQEAEDLINTMAIPFLTTPGGRGIISESHPLSLGLSGRYRSKIARNYINKADLLFTIGSSNEAFQTGHWEHLPPQAKFIQLDISSENIGKNWQPDIAVVGDVKTVIRQLLAENEEQEIIPDYSTPEKSKPKIFEKLKQKKEELQQEIRASLPQKSTELLAREVVLLANKVFGEDTILVNENGSQDVWSYFHSYYQVRSRLGCIPVAEQTCMGMGVVGAIAAKITEPERPVLCITGDGAFQMYLQEMATAVQYNAGCTWLVLNNKGLGWIRAKQQRAGFSTYSTEFTSQPALAETAESFGCLGLRVEDRKDLKEALEKAKKANIAGRPVVIDCQIAFNPDMSHLDDGNWWE